MGIMANEIWGIFMRFDNREVPNKLLIAVQLLIEVRNHQTARYGRLSNGCLGKRTGRSSGASLYRGSKDQPIYT